jgi:diphthine-ammonia ligase
MGGHDVVALVSGGKDSVMAAMLAQSYGHRVVALGNLLPAVATVEELDSHCFQTVGHNAVAVYGDLTGLPLFRRRLQGDSRHTEMTYEVGTDDKSGDEVEDLRALLACVKRKMPRVTAVTAGAILSDYQRLRVEAVCADLGLVSLAFLWQQPQGLVLDLICDANVDAVLIKVAAMGLEPRKHLGKSLDSMRAFLKKIEREYGSHCAGEGGEFETIVLDCPLFRRAHLTIDGRGGPEIVVTSLDPYAPSGHLFVSTSAVLAVAKENRPPDLPAGEVIDVVAGAPLARVVRRTVSDSFEAVKSAGVIIGVTEVGVVSGAEASSAHVHARVACANKDDPAAAASASCELALHAAANVLSEQFGLDWCDVDYVQLCVSNMSHFAEINAAYVRVVPVHSPPSRACVQLPLPDGVPVAVEVFATRSNADATKPPPRKSLHVQSLSCWAPACIGPYAQASSRAGVAHLAGSIGMDPATLDMVGFGLPGREKRKAEARRAWRSSVAVALGAGCDLARDVVAVTVFVVGDTDDPGGELAKQESAAALRAILRRDKWCARVDVPGGLFSIDAGVRPGRYGDNLETDETTEQGSDDGTHDPDDECFNASTLDEKTKEDERSYDEKTKEDRTLDHKTWHPLVTTVLVPRLPKNARVEVQCVLLDGGGAGAAVSKIRRFEDSETELDSEESDDDSDPQGSRNRSVVTIDGRINGQGGLINSPVVVGARFAKTRWCFARVAIEIGTVTFPSIENAVRALSETLANAKLGWHHVGSLRGYYSMKCDAKEREIRGWVDDAVGVAGGETEKESKKESKNENSRSKNENSKRGFRVALAPALGIGFGSVHDAGLVLELYAATRAMGRTPPDEC